MVFTNPFRKVRCPACGSTFYPGNCAIVSTVTSGKELQPERNDFWSRLWLQPIKGPIFVRELAARRCPNPDCQRVLPYNIERSKSFTIAIVGDSFSGKSHYIASCIQQLKQRQALQVIGCSRIVGLGTTDDNYLRDYYLPVFQARKQIPQTPRARTVINDPLVYELIFSRKSWREPGRSVNLLFYDSSGEDIALQDRLVQYSSYVLNASAVIFLADPLTMPDIIKLLPTDQRPPVIRERSTSDVLNRVMETFRLGLGKGPGEKVDVPVAITLSKSDLLKYVTRSEPSSMFLQDSTPTSRLNTQEFEKIDHEVQRLVTRVGDKVLIHSSDLFENVSFFAVSATGWAPDKGDFPAIEPLRCLDPLLWIMWKLGVIEAE